MKKTIPIPSNLLQQNCFLRDTTKKSSSCGVSPTTFDSIDEVTTDTGIELKRSSNPYQITPQYVNSFVESSDYRRDPISAVNNGVKKKNLGDITQFQDLSSLDTAQLGSLIGQLQERFANAQSEKKVSGVTETPNSDNGGSSDVK